MCVCVCVCDCVCVRVCVCVALALCHNCVYVWLDVQYVSWYLQSSGLTCLEYGCSSADVRMWYGN